MAFGSSFKEVMPVACGAHYFLQSRLGKIAALKWTYRILKLQPSVRVL